MCCAIPMYGPYVTAENVEQTDYYFVYGADTGASERLYKVLTGREQRLS